MLSSLDLVSSDALNRHYRQYKLQELFFLYLFLTLEETNQFHLTIKTPLENKYSEVNIPAVDFKSALAVNNANLENIYPELTKGKLSGEVFQDSTYVLTINSFDFNNEEKEALLQGFSGIFKKLNSESFKNLIIDVRHNQGGRRDVAAILYSYLTDETFRQRDSSVIKTIHIDTTYLMSPNNVAALNKYLKKTFGENQMEETDHLKDLMEPQEDYFRGNIAVVIGNGTFSAGAEFALTCKQNPMIKVFGEESGGNAVKHNGDLTLQFKLPNSGIEVKIPMVKIFHNLLDISDENRTDGIMPDFEVKDKMNNDLYREVLNSL
ncbi:MAG: hypothetical protein DHS20C18_35590 [Saprospiraceae bacterium]|nr:MAG: hypothetical protein DHS20C18_35590 [Saprospiraceae bacterium]